MAAKNKSVNSDVVEAKNLDGTSGSVFQKDFVVQKKQFVETDEKHERNIAATRQEAINLGLRPTEHGSFVGSEDHPDGLSVIQHYEVAVQPAVEGEAGPQVLDKGDTETASDNK